MMEEFMITAVGCGRAGFRPDQIAPLFSRAPKNCWFDTQWQPDLGTDKLYWGTYDESKDEYQYTDEYKTYIVGKTKEFIFVFGSNEAGMHGAGAARFARLKHGAVYGEGVGRKGNSYAIPTKDAKIHTLSLPKVKHYIDRFIAYAEKRTGGFVEGLVDTLETTGFGENQ